MKVNNPADLGKAIERGEDTIVVEGDLASRTIRIKATGKIAWVIAGGCIAVSIVAILSMPPTAATGPLAGPGFVAESAVIATGGAGAISVLGVSATVAAVSIGVGAKSKNAVNKLRNGYTLTKVNDRKIILKKK